MSRLENKVVVITGASKGFGRALVDAFAKEKCRLSLAARSMPDLLKIQDEYRKQGIDVFVHPVDVTQEGQVEELARGTVKQYGRIDFWINNAGTLTRGPVDEIKPEEVKRVFEVNTFGTMYGCKYALQQMKKQKSGNIINVISTTGIEGKPNEAVYSASKGAIITFAQGLRKEALEHKIKVTDFNPGGMNTELFKGMNIDASGWMDPYEVAKVLVSIAALPDNAVTTNISIRRI